MFADGDAMELPLGDGITLAAGDAIELAADATTSSWTAPEEPVEDEHPATATSTAAPTTTETRCLIARSALPGCEHP